MTQLALALDAPVGCAACACRPCTCEPIDIEPQERGVIADVELIQAPALCDVPKAIAWTRPMRVIPEEGIRWG